MRTRACLCPTLGQPGHPRPVSQPHAPYTAPVLRCFPEAPRSWPVGCGEPLGTRQGHRLAKRSATGPAEQSPKAALRLQSPKSPGPRCGRWGHPGGWCQHSSLTRGPGWDPSPAAPDPHVATVLHRVFVNTLASFGPEKVFKCVIYFSNHDNCYKINKSLEKLPLGVLSCLRA